MTEEFKKQFEKWEANGGVRDFFSSNCDDDFHGIPRKSFVKSTFERLLKKCGKYDESMERLIDTGDVCISMTNDIVRTISIEYYDKLIISFDGFGYKSHFRSNTDIYIPYNFL